MMVMMWVGALLAALTAAAAPYDSTEFVALNHSRPALWVFEDTGVEMLFVAEPARTALDCGVDAAVDAFGEAAPSVAPGLSIAGYRVDSAAVAASSAFGAVAAAPALRELADWIDESPTRCLPSERGLLFEAVELLCFCLGYKPVVLRQRLLRGGGGAHNAVVHGAPGICGRRTRAVLAWLTTGPGRAEVWRGAARNEWGDGDDPPFEDSLVFAHAATHADAGRRLVELRAQDASVPGQASRDATAEFIAEVGRLLAYPADSVRAYMADEMLVGYEPRLVDRALDRGAASAARSLAADVASFVVRADRLPALPGLDALLDAPLDGAALSDAASALDWLFPLKTQLRIAHERRRRVVGGGRQPASYWSCSVYDRLPQQMLVFIVSG
ncbi:hypothetical protein JL721_12891 [Aureococcus anophagefferens]|nr:hypothetical protein JL721_12891 [Aureococcus anophagefferens]